MSRRSLIAHGLLAGTLALSTLVGPVQAGDTASNGTFRFLTESLPVGTTNLEYVARIVSVNADGPVLYAVIVMSSL